MESEKNLAIVRHRHHENRRKSKFDDRNNLTKFLCVDLVVRLYDYLCVMSTIPTINPALTMQNINSKSKTTLASGFGSL